MVRVSKQMMVIDRMADLLVGLSVRGDKHVEFPFLHQAALYQSMYRRLLTKQQESIACSDIHTYMYIEWDELFKAV